MVLLEEAPLPFWQVKIDCHQAFYMFKKQKSRQHLSFYDELAKGTIAYQR